MILQIARSLTIALFICSFFLPVVSAQNENGGVRISFGDGSEYSEPRTLSGDDPAVPPKPKRTFSTNSIVLNQILQSCDESFDAFNKTFEKLQKMEKITLGTEDNPRENFTIVYNFETKEIVAVLDKGTGKKMNLLTNQFVTDENFTNEIYQKIYFLINE
jgi:hypothetical protein